MPGRSGTSGPIRRKRLRPGRSAPLPGRDGVAVEEASHRRGWPWPRRRPRSARRASAAGAVLRPRPSASSKTSPLRRRGVPRSRGPRPQSTAWHGLSRVDRGRPRPGAPRRHARGGSRPPPSSPRPRRHHVRHAHPAQEADALRVEPRAGQHLQGAIERSGMMRNCRSRAAASGRPPSSMCQVCRRSAGGGPRLPAARPASARRTRGPRTARGAGEVRRLERHRREGEQNGESSPAGEGEAGEDREREHRTRAKRERTRSVRTRKTCS